MFKKTRQATELIKAMIGPAKAKVELMELCQSRWFGRFEFILIYLFKNLQLVVLGHNLYLNSNNCSYLELGYPKTILKSERPNVKTQFRL